MTEISVLLTDQVNRICLFTDGLNTRINPKICVNSKWGANRAKLVQGGRRVNPAAVLTTT